MSKLNIINCIKIIKKNKKNFFIDNEYNKILELLNIELNNISFNKNNTIIIECIEILRKNKKNFTTFDEYNNLLELLYQELDNINNINYIHIHNLILNDNDDIIKNDIYNKKYDDIIYNYKFNCLSDLLNCKYKKILVLKFPLLNLLYQENNKPYYKNLELSIQNNPIIEINKKHNLINDIKLLLNIFANIVKIENRSIIIIVICDLIFRNFYFAIENKKFLEVFKNKINEFNNENILKNILIKYNFNETIIQQWCEILENI